jgi:DNA replicative helicase MCM subunit Mcm2 (Cdc46/Mcm family)
MIICFFGYRLFGIVIQRNGMLKMTKQKDPRMVQSKLICQECGEKVVIQRRKAEQCKLGHIKHMYCPNCNETRAFTEIKDWDRNVIFWEEYQNALLNEQEKGELWDALWMCSSESLHV